MKQIILSTIKEELIISDNQELIVIDDLDLSENDNLNKAFKVTIGKNCKIQYLCLIKSSLSGDKYQEREISLGDFSQMRSYRFYLNAQEALQKFTILIGNSARLDSQVFFLQTKNNKITISDDYIFKSPNSYGRFLVTGILKNESAAKYFSEVVIKEGAQGIDTRIDMKLYLLDKGAKGSLLPSLKIAANEVKAGHGASTFKLSKEDLFYLNSRGLTEEAVKNLVIDSLLDNILKDIPLIEFKENILMTVANFDA